MVLRPEQKDALKRMSNGCILNGKVGSGKSITALAYYYILNGGTFDWDGEVQLMDDPPLDLYIITTAQKRDKHEWENEMACFLIHPQHGIYNHVCVVDSWNNIQKYKDVTNAFFIFDEQRVVGKGMWSKTFVKIAKRNQWILLTATPGDKWADYIPVFIANGFYKNRSEFERNHFIYSRFSKFPDVIDIRNEGRLIRLRNKILVDMDVMRHTVQHHIDITCGYDRQAYKRLMRERFNYEKGVPFQSAGELCYALRKVVNSDESRTLIFKQLCKKHKRVIVFYNFDYELDILRNVDYGSDVVVAEWNGHRHDELPSSKKWVYLVQYIAGAEGWNCVKTDTIIFWSQTYSYKQTEQASGRIDRLNTAYVDLYYYHLKTKAPIDIAIEKALKEKKQFNERKFIGS